MSRNKQVTVSCKCRLYTMPLKDISVKTGVKVISDLRDTIEMEMGNRYDAYLVRGLSPLKYYELIPLLQ